MWSHCGFDILSPIDVVIRAPKVRGKVYVNFKPAKLSQAGERNKKAVRDHQPANDKFSKLFFKLMGKENWDVRVAGLHSLIEAYPTGKTPYEFQTSGIAFLVKSPVALLADEMGLGKTIQAILAFRARIHGGEIERVLIVCPKALLGNWAQEVSEWAPELSIAVAHGPDRVKAFERPHHVYITNYHTVMNTLCEKTKKLRGVVFDPRERFRPFDLIVLDEVQEFRNASNQSSNAIRALPTLSRWGMTGTPIENSLDDYRGVWRAIDPTGPYHSLNESDLLSLTRKSTLRRTKSEVLTDLPDQTSTVRYIRMEGKQLVAYRKLEKIQLANARSAIKSRKYDEGKLRIHIFKLIADLKKICIFDSVSRESAKFEWLLQFHHELNPSGVLPFECEKAIIFTQYPKLVDDWGLQHVLGRFKPLRYHSGVPERDKGRFAKTFNDDESVRTAILGIKSGSTGLNLTRANHLIFLDAWWNPAIMQQAAARIHRIGQTKRSYVVNLVVKDTIEERILQILEEKRELSDRVMKEIREGRANLGDNTALQKALTMDDMLRALGLE